MEEKIVEEICEKYGVKHRVAEEILKVCFQYCEYTEERLATIEEFYKYTLQE